MHAVELAAIVVVSFVAGRIVSTFRAGTATAATEHEVVEVLQAIHRAESEARAGADGRFLLLPELIAAAEAGSALARLHPAGDAPPGTDVFAAYGYLFALYVVNPADAEHEKAWARAAVATDPAETRGYGAFAWPRHVDDDAQWAYFVSHRGLLLGSWNQRGLLDGYEPPFPPTVHPLREYLHARAEDEDGAWVKVLEVGELP